jgi:hypothetical protein
MMKAPDDIDFTLLDRISRNPGCSISEAIKPLLIERSETVLRGRIRSLSLKN